MTMIRLVLDDRPVRPDGAGAQDVAVAETAAVAPLVLIGTDVAAACTDAACLPPEAVR
jgi:hypothetical protein